MLLPKNNNNSNGENQYLGIETISVNTKDVINMDIDYDFTNEKDKDKFIKLVERFIRGSFEYRNYIGFLKGELNLTKCSFLDNIDIENIKGVSLEFHHYPFTLYDLVSVVLNKYLENNEDINALKISEEVMRLHYENKVGLIPVTLTVHQLIHSGQLFVPTTKVYGNYNKFIESYKPYISDLHQNFVNIIEDRTKKIENGEEILDTSVIARKTIEVENIDCEKMNIIESEDEEHTA